MADFVRSLEEGDGRASINTIFDKLGKIIKDIEIDTIGI